jgi:hypothetical protein
MYWDPEIDRPGQSGETERVSERALPQHVDPAHRLEARRVYRACPPFRVQFRKDGRALLEVKH